MKYLAVGKKEENATFEGTLVDCITLLEETQGNINIKINYNDSLYDIREFKKLAEIK